MIFECDYEYTTSVCGMFAWTMNIQLEYVGSLSLTMNIQLECVGCLSVTMNIQL